MKIFTKLILITISIVVLMVYFFPNQVSKLKNHIAQMQEWDEATIQSDPLGYLEYSLQKERQHRQDLSLLTNQLENEVHKVSKSLEKSQTDLERATNYFNEGKRLWRIAEIDGRSRFEFAGRSYPDSQSFKLQLQLLFEEQTQHKKLVAILQEHKHQLEQQLKDLLLQNNQLDVTIAMIETTMVSVSAKQAMNNLKDVSDKIDSINQQTTKLIASTRTLVTSNELNQSQQQSLHKSQAQVDFDAVLSEDTTGKDNQETKGAESTPAVSPKQQLFNLSQPVSICKVNCKDFDPYGESNCQQGVRRTITNSAIPADIKTIVVTGTLKTRSDTCGVKSQVIANIGSQREITEVCPPGPKEFNWVFDQVATKQLDIELRSGDWCAMVENLTVVGR